MASREAGPRVSSSWIPMSDGVRVAIDLILPSTDERAPFPTVLMATRYWRSFAMRTPDRPRRAPMGPRAPIADELAARGFATVIVDARGTGASEGTWDYMWSPREQLDNKEVIDWVVGQTWSNGSVGATGLSYEGTTAMLLAASGHPAVKAVAPRAFEYSVYEDIALPGGILNIAFLKAWGEMTAALDRDKPPRLFGLTGRALIKGARPVDIDAGGKGHAEIVRRRRNPSVYDSLKGIEFRDDSYGSQGVTLDDLSVRACAERIREHDVPAQIWGSWRDGTTADSVLRMYEELPSVREARIGAWSHTGEQHASPFAEGGDPNPPLIEQWDQVIGFLEGPLRGTTEAPSDRLIHYFVMGAEEWRTTPSWPPAGIEETTLYLNGASKLTGEPPATKVVDRTTLHPRASTGKRNRWHTQLAKPVHYGDRSRADQLVMTWAAGTLSRPTEITGRPEARFRVRTEGDDLSLFVYLEAVDPRGRVLLLTEGMFRALHRAPRGLGVTYRRDDAVPVEPGVPMELIIRMLPISVVLPAGWAIRMALAGADADTFEAADSPRDLEIHLEYDADDPATLTLPILRDRPI